MSDQAVRFSWDNLKPFINDNDLKALAGDIRRAHDLISKRNGKGSQYLGWLDLPHKMQGKELKDITDCAGEIRDSGDTLIVIGIGGSYLGSRAAIEFCNSYDSSRNKQVLFAGCNIDPDYLRFILDDTRDRNVYVNVVSKSGTTIEPALAFRVILESLKKKYPAAELKKRIICTTDRNKGALRKFADSSGARSFVVPDDLGGRFSVLSPVGLLPASAAGLDVGQMLLGARDMDARSQECCFEGNIVYAYAACRQALYRKGKKIEMLSAFNPYLSYLLEWWKQLFGESEGKEGKGIFPASSVLTTDLHSMGQLLQEGERNMFETFLAVDKPNNEICVPGFDSDMDGLDLLIGREMSYINQQALLGTSGAHLEGGLPNMTINVAQRNEYCLGALFYFFEKAVALSGYIQDVNPFDQPGVEAYKKNMFKLLGLKK